MGTKRTHQIQEQGVISEKGISESCREHCTDQKTETRTLCSQDVLVNNYIRIVLCISEKITKSLSLNSPVHQWENHKIPESKQSL